MKTMLTKADLNYLLTQQEKLDSAMRKELGISNNEWQDMNGKHLKALRIETAEMVNEMHDVWKYWKKKQVDKGRILDEAIDVIHFCCLMMNKFPQKLDEKYQCLHDELEIAIEIYGVDSVDIFFVKSKNEKIEEIQDALLRYPNPIYNHFSDVLILLDLYGFTAKDIIDQYNIKNEENFRRLASGY